MRLWDKRMISYLPNNQLLAQWRECCCIAKNIATQGTPNHLLVNKILDYNPTHFIYYCHLVKSEMEKRGFNLSKESYVSLIDNINKGIRFFNSKDKKPIKVFGDLFYNWHTLRYTKQCFNNLEEKYDCGGIPKDEWDKLNSWYYKDILGIDF